MIPLIVLGHLHAAKALNDARFDALMHAHAAQNMAAANAHAQNCLGQRAAHSQNSIGYGMSNESDLDVMRDDLKEHLKDWDK